MAIFNLFKKDVKEISKTKFPEAKIKNEQGELEQANRGEVRDAVAESVKGGVITPEGFDKRLKNIGLQGEQYSARNKVKKIEEIKEKFD